MLTRIKVKVKLQHTGNCGDKISTILFKQRACRRENTPAVDTNSTPWWGENEWLNWAKQICSSREKNTSLHPSPLLSSPLLSSPLLSCQYFYWSSATHAFTCGHRRDIVRTQQGEGQEAAIQQWTVDFAWGRPEGVWRCSVCVCARVFGGNLKRWTRTVSTSVTARSFELAVRAGCAAVFPYRKTVCVQTETEAITLILSSCFTSFHFIAVFLCLSVWVAVSGRMRAWEEGREETVVVAERCSRTIHKIYCIKKKKSAKSLDRVPLHTYTHKIYLIIKWGDEAGMWHPKTVCTVRKEKEDVLRLLNPITTNRQFSHFNE